METMCIPTPPNTANLQVLLKWYLEVLISALAIEGGMSGEHQTAIVSGWLTIILPLMQKFHPGLGGLTDQFGASEVGEDVLKKLVELDGQKGATSFTLISPTNAFNCDSDGEYYRKPLVVALMKRVEKLLNHFDENPYVEPPPGATPCRNGVGCMPLKNGFCKFFHPPGDHPKPPEACKNGAECNWYSQGRCKFGHPEPKQPYPCRNGPDCWYLKNGTCRYQH